ncbi:MAG: pyridoxamine 5'-phosphate oxidase family protein [Alteromonadaceae bacterium]|nr:pyridoxamine 5'-phosphate oxidase family protein [Alteromonadaceae bacterium]
MLHWQTLLESSLKQTRDEPESRFFQLATVNDKGMAQNRTVVCRDFSSENDTLRFISDTRSAKFAELRHQPNAAICWYFALTREQYRLTVAAAIDTPQTNIALCEHYWQGLSRLGRQQFLWGRPASIRPQPQQPLQTATDSEVVPVHFCVVTLNVFAVDYLNLKGNPQQRQSFEKKHSQWHSTDLIP